MPVRRVSARIATFAYIAIVAVTAIAWAQKSTPSRPSPHAQSSIAPEATPAVGTSPALSSDTGITARAGSDVSLFYMDDLLPQMWFPRDHIPTPTWLSADSSQRRPMSWALWYSAMARYVAGHKDIMLVVLAKESQTVAARKALTDSGASVQFELSEIGFFRTLVPLSSISQIYQDPSVEEIESAAYSWSGLLVGSLYRPNTDLKDYERLNSQYLVRRVSPVGDPALLQCCTTQAIFNPTYLAERAANRGIGFISRSLPDADLGLVELRKSHPTFDGRGVTVGVYDAFPQLNHPALGEALNLEGERIPKIPRVPLDPSTFTRSPLSVFAFHRPLPDELLRFGPLLSSLGSQSMLVSEARIDREYADTIKAVFDPGTGRFGFDIDKDGRLGATEWFRDYRISPSESVLYTTQFPTGSKQSAVFFLFADFASAAGPKATFVLENLHGTMASNAIGASGGDRLTALGLAPGSQIIPYSWLASMDPQYDQTSSSLDQLLNAILAKDIDIVTAQNGFVLSEDNYYGLSQKAIERALAVRPKAVFVSSGNTTSSIDGHFGRTAEFARGVIAIGASIGPTAGAALFGRSFGGRTVADPITATGPASDGARATLLFTASRYPYYSSCLPGDINLRSSQPAFADSMPNCTWLTWATSGAAPPAAAVAASLFSGLRQRGYIGDSTVVAKALAASAEPLDHNGFDFVAGQVSASRAWDWLEQNVLAKPARPASDPKSLSGLFEMKAPIRHEASLRTQRLYSTRGVYDRYFDLKDIGRCTAIWVRSPSPEQSNDEHKVTLEPSGGSVELVTTKLTASAVWQPITLCVAAPIDGVWSGTVSIHGMASETHGEQHIPVTIVAPVRLRPGENSPSAPVAHFDGMLRETFASLPLAARADDKVLARVIVTPQPGRSQDSVLDWVTMNGSHGTPGNPVSKTGVHDEAGLLVRARLVDIPIYPAADFSLPKQLNLLKRSGAFGPWSVSVNTIPLQEYVQLRPPPVEPCLPNDHAPTVLLRANAKSDVTELQSACLPDIGTAIVSFTATSSIDSLVIVKPQPVHQYDLAVFRYRNGIWLPQIFSFNSVWKTHEELKNLPQGEWRIFLRRVGPPDAIDPRAGTVALK
jgi:hypothetical protein